jgi:hypothetical protein
LGFSVPFTVCFPSEPKRLTETGAATVHRTATAAIKR